MLITKTKIRNPELYILGIKQGDFLYVTKKLQGIDNKKLKKIGFPEQISEGIKILGRGIGPVSRFNNNGSFIPLKNLPKETKYRSACIKDWHGDYHFVDIPYKRYQRKTIPAPESELLIQKIGEELYIVSDKLKYSNENSIQIRHVINLFLEYFGECEILNESLQVAFHDIPTRRVNWEMLPEGEYPWNRIPSDGIKRNGVLTKIDQKHTFDTISKYHPTNLTIGMGGFRGYIAFHFPDKGFVLLEHMLYGNATYVFDKDWETLSQLTKKEIIDENLCKRRIIHQKGWENEIHQLLK